MRGERLGHGEVVRQQDVEEVGEAVGLGWVDDRRGDEAAIGLLKEQRDERRYA